MLCVQGNPEHSTTVAVLNTLLVRPEAVTLLPIMGIMALRGVSFAGFKAKC